MHAELGDIQISKRSMPGVKSNQRLWSRKPCSNHEFAEPRHV